MTIPVRIIDYSGQGRGLFRRFSRSFCGRFGWFFSSLGLFFSLCRLRGGALLSLLLWLRLLRIVGHVPLH